MGRKCGWLAMMAGIAGGAEYVLVPEVKYDLNKICDELKHLMTMVAVIASLLLLKV